MPGHGTRQLGGIMHIAGQHRHARQGLHGLGLRWAARGYRDSMARSGQLCAHMLAYKACAT
jgi:hypothetical protein